MATWEYRTDLAHFQPGAVQRNDKGEYVAGLTTHYLCEMGKLGWELVQCFPWQVATAQIALSQGGAELPPATLALFCVFKRKATET